MDGGAGGGGVVVRHDVLTAGGFEHFGEALDAVDAKLTFIFLQAGIEGDGGHAPGVLLILVEVHAVLVVGEEFTEAGSGEVPVARFHHGGLEAGAEGSQGVALPAPCPTLVAEAPEVILFGRRVEVAEAGDVETTVRLTSFVVLVLHTGEASAAAHPVVVIHNVVAQFAGVITEAVGEPLALAVQHDGRGADRGSVHEEDLAEVFFRLFRFRVNDVDADGLPGLFVVDDAVDDAVGN